MKPILVSPIVGRYIRLFAVTGSGLALLAMTAACSPTLRDTGSTESSDGYNTCMTTSSAGYCNNVSSGSGQSYNQYTSASSGSDYGAPGTAGTYYNNTAYPYTSTYSSSQSPYSGSNYNYGVGSSYYHSSDRALSPDQETASYRAAYAAYLEALPEDVRADMRRQWENAP